MSTLSLTGEYAHLIPGQPKAINKEGTSYIDDFEASQSAIDLRQFSAWKMASIPQGQPDLFPEASSKNVSAGFKRAKAVWYTIDPVFYQLLSVEIPVVPVIGDFFQSILDNTRLRIKKECVFKSPLNL